MWLAGTPRTVTATAWVRSARFSTTLSKWASDRQTNQPWKPKRIEPLTDYRRSRPAAPFKRELPDLVSSLKMESGKAKRRDNETPPEAAKALLDQLTPELVEEVVGLSTGKKFKIKEIEKDLIFLAQRNFPLPSSLTLDHWKRLLELENSEIRNLYLESIVNGKDESQFEELRRQDAQLTAGFDFDCEMVRRLVAEDPEQLEPKLHLIRGTYERVRASSRPVPPLIEEKHFRELLTCHSSGKIESVFRFLVERRSAKVLSYIKKRGLQAVAVERRQVAVEDRANENHIVYGLGHNTLFYRILDQTMEKQNNWRVAREYHDWGQPLVIDMSFLHTMNAKQARSVLHREVPYALKHNRESKAPFAIHICGFDRSNHLCANFLEETKIDFDADDSPITLTEKSYLDLFPTERLVYLTPDSRNDFRLDSEDIPIIGGLNDVGIPTTLSFAKRLQIRHARLPLRRTIGMTFELNVETVVAILADYRESRDWFFSFRWIPSRHYRTRLASNYYLKENEYMYKAHHQLNPTRDESLADMTSWAYRRRFAEIVRQCANVADSEKNPEEEKDHWNSYKSYPKG